jgi:hypothetical protein
MGVKVKNTVSRFTAFPTGFGNAVKESTSAPVLWVDMNWGVS